jgi:hypothetical protein
MGAFWPDGFLGVSPVFEIHGISRWELMDFEAKLRQTPGLLEDLRQALPHHADPGVLIDRPCESPPDRDYLDILNPTIGILFHRWKFGETSSYPNAPVWIDGGNMSVLGERRLGFNGMVARISDFQTLLNLSHDTAQIPDFLIREMSLFEQFLREVGGFTEARIIPPAALYVRQTLTLQSRHNLTARQIVAGGVCLEEVIGSYSYWLDCRGLVLAERYPGESLPKPVFNVGLDVAFPARGPRNLAFVGRSSGYSPLSQGVGRIVQHNALLGEAVGIAAALASKDQCAIEEVPVSAVREILERRGAKPILGQANWPEETRQNSRMLQADEQALQRAHWQVDTRS